MKVNYITIRKDGFTICGCPKYGYCVVLHGHVIRKPFSDSWKFTTIEDARDYVDHLSIEED